jgi:succinoglycan biosynthesis transport protein ExoP
LEALIQIIWRRKWIITATLVVALIVAYFGSRMIEPTYEATTTLRVSSSGGSIDYVRQEIDYVDRIMATYANIATSAIILNQLPEVTESDTLPTIDIEVLANTELMQIKVEHNDPEIAANVANSLANLLIDYSQTSDSNRWNAATDILEAQLAEAKAELDQAQAEYDALIREDPLTPEQIAEFERLQEIAADATFASLLSMEQETYRSQIGRASSSLAVRSAIYTRLVESYTDALATGVLSSTSLTVIDPADVPPTPSKPDVTRNMLLGSALGLLGGLGLTFLYDRLDTTVHSVEHLETLIDQPILGRVPLARWSGMLSFLEADTKFLHPEAFRRLRINLLNVMRKEALRTIMVTSAAPGEGKSTVVVNLATSLVEARKRVLIIDSDLHRPMMHLTFGLENKIGLTSVLKGDADLDEAIQETDMPGVFVLTSGPPTPEPNALLSSVLMANTLDHASYKYDVVLLDSPAFLAVADTSSLAGMVCGVILVASIGYSRREAILALREEFDKINAHPIGVVANRVRNDLVSQYSRHYMTVPAAEAEPVNLIVVPAEEATPELEAVVSSSSAKQEARSARPQLAPGEKQKVLIVEDSEEILALMEQALKRLDYEVMAVQDGVSGTQLSKEWKPDVVLLDVMMPEVSGLEVCRQLRADSQTADTLIIMVTARSSIDDKREGFYAGADDYLVKPFTTQELALRIEALLRLETRRGSMIIDQS